MTMKEALQTFIQVNLCMSLPVFIVWALFVPNQFEIAPKLLLYVGLTAFVITVWLHFYSKYFSKYF